MVAGRVQGVGFRRFVQRRAKELGLAGYAANLPDGRVEVLAEGDAAELERLEASLRRGPPLAHVTQVQVQPGPEGGALSGFGVR